MGITNDSSDAMPPNPTDGFTETDYSVRANRRVSRPAAITKENFNPPKGQKVPEIKRQVFQGRVVGLVNSPATEEGDQTRYYWVRRQDGAVGKAKREETQTDEADFRFGDHVSLIEGAERDTYLIIGRPTPVEQAAIYAQVDTETTFPREEADLRPEEIEYDPPEEEGGIPTPKEDPDLEQVPFVVVEQYPINDQFGGYNRLTIGNSGRITANVGGVYDVDISLIIGTAAGDPQTELDYGGVGLLTVSEARAQALKPFATRIAQQYGLNVTTVNEYYHPTGMSEYGGMIGLIEDARVEDLVAAYSSWVLDDTPSPDDIPMLSKPGVINYSRCHLIEIIRYDETIVDDPGTEDVDEAEPLSGLHFCVFLDSRYRYQGMPLNLSPKDDPAFDEDSYTWDSILTDKVQPLLDDFFNTITIPAIASVYLSAEFEIDYAKNMTLPEWMDAAAWSIGCRWIVPLGTNNLTLEPHATAVAARVTNMAADNTILEGEYTEDNIFPVTRVYTCYPKAISGVIVETLGKRLIQATGTGTGYYWRCDNLALSEESPVFGEGQETLTILTDLAEQLLLDAKAWCELPYNLTFDDYPTYVHSGRDKYIRFFERTTGSKTIVQSLTYSDLPSRLVTRSTCWPLDPYRRIGDAVTAASPGGSLTVTIGATARRLARKINASYPSVGAGGGGGNITIGEGVVVEFAATGSGTWIVTPETTS